MGVVCRSPHGAGNSGRKNYLKPFDPTTRTLSLEQVYGAITFYVGAREEVKKDITEREHGAPAPYNT